MSLGQVLELPSGSWVNDPFEAQVLAIETKNKSAGGKFWVCTLGDSNTSARAEMALFTAPKFAQGDTIEIGGKGIKFEETQYGNKISAGKNAEIHVTHSAAAGRPAPAQNNSHRPAVPGPAPAEPPQRPGDVTEFHRTMKKMALFYCHAMKYAAEIDQRIPFVTPEQQQACVSTLFIEGCKRQLVDIVPAL